MDKKTPDNFNYGDMTADFRMKYKQMLERHNASKGDKKKTKKKDLAEELYGGTK